MNHLGKDGPLGKANPEELADGGSLLLVEGSSCASAQVKFSLKGAAFPGRGTMTSLVKTSQLTQTPVTEIGWGRKGGRAPVQLQGHVHLLGAFRMVKSLHSPGMLC